MEYTDVHRMFVQGMMSHTVLAEKDAVRMFSKICEEVDGDECPSMKALEGAIRQINEHVSPMNMKVKRAICEVTGDPFFVLVNTVQTNIPSKVPRYAKAASQTEKEFLKVVLHAIVLSPYGCVSSVDCLNLCNTLPSARITRSDADKLLQKMIEKKWFVENCSMVSLSVRCIAEMEPYIRQLIGDAETDCKLCRNIVLQGKICVHCLTKFHTHCIGTYLRRQPHQRCPECRGDWQDGAPCDDQLAAECD